MNGAPVSGPDRDPGTGFDLDGMALVDHHAHSVVDVDLDRRSLEALLTESDRPPPPGTTVFDSALGLAVRRWCAPVLDLAAGAEPVDYVARRAELGAAEVNRRFLSGTGVEVLAVDTGFAPDRLAGLDRLAAWSGATVVEVVRLEAVAEAVARAGVTADRFAGAVDQALHQARRTGAVATKSVAAYRTGLDLDWSRPGPDQVRAAAREWLARPGPPRLDDPVLVRHLVWAGVDTGLPLQFHTGFGDNDLVLHRSDPSLLTGLLAASADGGAPIMLLHCWPYHRQAAHLAALWPQVHLDVGLTLPHVGARAGAILAEVLEMAPWAKLLYSSDCYGAAELSWLAAHLWRRGLGQVLDALAADDWADRELLRLADLVSSGNARRVYDLPHPPVAGSTGVGG